MAPSIAETTFAVTDPGYTSGNTYQRAFYGVTGYDVTETYTNPLVFHLGASLSTSLKTFTRDALSRLDAILALDFRETADQNDRRINFLYRIAAFEGSTLGATETHVSSTTSGGQTTYDLDVTIGFEISSGVALAAYPEVSDATAQTILHEMGHSLGLSHPYDDGWMDGFSSSDTLMSYFWTSTGSATPFFREADIQALAGLWGTEHPLTAANWFVQTSSGSSPAPSPSTGAAGGGGGGAVAIIPRETSQDRSRGRGSAVTRSRATGGSNTRTTSLGGSRGSRDSRGSSRSSQRFMLADPITNPGRRALQPVGFESPISRTNTLASYSSSGSTWVPAWTQQFQTSPFSAADQLNAGFATNWL